jgi:phosphoglycerate dehydrogenase-like enzyme
MEVLLLDALAADAQAWLKERQYVLYAPHLVEDTDALQAVLGKVRALVVPSNLPISADLLQCAPNLQAIAQLRGGTANMHLESLRNRGVYVINPASVVVRSHAEFLLSALVIIRRRGMLSYLFRPDAPSPPMGNELYETTIGLIGLAPATHVLVPMLKAMGMRVIGYDPAIHRDAPIWAELGVHPVPIQELVAQADTVSLQMLYASRFKGWINDRILEACKPNQAWVCMTRSTVFEPVALSEALGTGRIASMLIDTADEGFAAEGTPLHGMKNLYITPRLGALTVEAHARASWYVARRFDAVLQTQSNPIEEFKYTVPQAG